MRKRKIVTTILCLAAILQSTVLMRPTSITVEPVVDKLPKPIKQGPLEIRQGTPGDPYWYQTGAMGDSQSYNYDAANVTIRTVYDRTNNDAHSYWVGGFISNGAFIQVGYVNEISTTNQPYCCAWFYEYFLATNPNCCAPVIGREGSAGPIGSWHTYSMTHTGNGTWSFYMDNRYLGATPPLGATNSGKNAPAGIAEVAQASSNTDILGPAEFKDLNFHNATAGWRSVTPAYSFIYYGTGTPPNPPSNPYGVIEVWGIENDFLAGSDIPQLNNPMRGLGPKLWGDPNNLTNRINFTFLDAEQTGFEPTWVSLRSTTGPGRIFYTKYQNQKIGNYSWTVDKVIWHTVNVAPSTGVPLALGATNLTIQSIVFSVKLRLVGAIFGLPVRGARVLVFLPDTLNVTATTDSTGSTVIPQLPPGPYVLRISVPYGIASIVSQNVQSSNELTSRVLGLAEMLLIIILPISVAVLVVVIAVRRERLRTGTMPTIPPSLVIAGNCPNCGQVLHITDQYCPNCGTALKQPSS